MTVNETPFAGTIHPLTPDRFGDIERLFGERGAYGGCWCVWWRLGNAEFTAGKGEGNRNLLRRITEQDPPGLIGYDGDTPAGWCAVAPRDRYSRLARSRMLKPVDDTPVWSITCFFVARPFRRRGLTRALIEAAVVFARERGAVTIEAYPVDPDAGYPDVYAYTGLLSAFRAAGFHEVIRRSSLRPIVRRDLATDG